MTNTEAKQQLFTLLAAFPKQAEGFLKMVREGKIAGPGVLGNGAKCGGPVEAIAKLRNVRYTTVAKKGIDVSELNAELVQIVEGDTPETRQEMAQLEAWTVEWLAGR